MDAAPPAPRSAYARPGAFLASFALVAATIGLAIPAANIAVDPFWRFNLVAVPGLNAQKPSLAGNARMGKAGRICALQPRQLILGTSRVEVGIDPGHPALADLPGPIYNAALAGSGIGEVLLTLQHAVHASPRLKRVMVGLDFLMFNANREAVVFGTEVFGFDKGRLLLSPGDTCWSNLSHEAGEWLGATGLGHVLHTLTHQLPPASLERETEFASWLALYDAQGFRPHFTVLDLPAKERGYRRLFGASRQEDAYAAKVWRPAPDERYCFTRDGERDTRDVFRELVRTARQSGAETIFFINPIHARLAIAIQEAGLWPQYEDWKRSLVGILDDEARSARRPTFPLWDFSGFNAVTTEHIPSEGDLAPVRWFWEPSHYRREAGDLMLPRMLGRPDDRAPADFGTRLSPGMIEDFIVEQRAKGREYAAREAAEVAPVRASVSRIVAVSGGSDCGAYLAPLRAAALARQRGDEAAAKAALAEASRIRGSERERAEALGVPDRETIYDTARELAEQGRVLPVRLASWEAYQARGVAVAATGDKAAAAEDFATAIRIGPPNTALRYLLGTKLLDLGRTERALAEFEEGLKLDPSNVTLKSLVRQTRLRLEGREPDAAQAAKLQAEADEARRRGDLPGAIRLYGEAIAVSPPNTALYYLRGTALLEQGAPAAALADFEAGLELDPSNVTLKALRDRARRAG